MKNQRKLNLKTLLQSHRLIAEVVAVVEAAVQEHHHQVEIQVLQNNTVLYTTFKTDLFVFI